MTIKEFQNECQYKLKALTELKLLKAYDDYIIITILNKTISLPFEAMTYNAIMDALTDINKENTEY